MNKKLVTPNIVLETPLENEARNKRIESKLLDREVDKAHANTNLKIS